MLPYSELRFNWLVLDGGRVASSISLSVGVTQDLGAKTEK